MRSRVISTDIRCTLLFLLISGSVFSQVPKTGNSQVPRPKLVVGLVVDQMRWDYLYRFYDRYAANGGFRRLLNKGFNCENTMINYIPTYTACGHTTLYTGSVPAIHGITGNEWWENQTASRMYCTSDTTVQGVGSQGTAGQMSPRNMQVTSICDELRLATNFRSKVIGIAFKDRGGILPAGHSANAAYWYEGSTGNWISSTYYMTSLPSWVTEFNKKKYPDQFIRQGWNTLYPIASYTQSASDNDPAESQPFGKGLKGFPYDLQKAEGNKYSVLSTTPYGNTLTGQMAMAAINAEELGKDSITDFLAVSFSSTDYVGHSFGPNSVEVEDSYLRLDKDLGELLDFLDQKVGTGEYLVFLSADHGVAHNGRFSEEHKLPGGGMSSSRLQTGVDSVLQSRFGKHKFIASSQNNQLYLNHALMDSLKTDEDLLIKTIKEYLSGLPEIQSVFATRDAMLAPLPAKVRNMVVNGYFPPRSGDVQFLLKSGYMAGNGTGTTHGSWNPYDAHIPLIWYGWKVKPGKLFRETYMTDVAPTIAALLAIQMPSGSVGDVIPEVVGGK